MGTGSRRAERDEQAREQECEAEAERATEQREKPALGEQVADEPATACTESQSHRDLALPC